MMDACFMLHANAARMELTRCNKREKWAARAAHAKSRRHSGRTTDSARAAPVAPNLLERRFAVDAYPTPDQVVHELGAQLGAALAEREVLRALGHQAEHLARLARSEHTAARRQPARALAAIPCHNRSASVRTERLWIRPDGVLHSG